VLQVTLHTEGQSLRWGFCLTASYRKPFTTLARTAKPRGHPDREGDEFSGPRATQGTSSFPTRPSIERIDRIIGRDVIS